MQTIKQILAIHGYDAVQDMDINESITIPGGTGMMDLTIERIGEEQISVAHYYQQRGDLMRDPEIVFRVDDDDNWTPIEYRQDPFTFEAVEDPATEALSLDGFENTWDRNLRSQCYIDRAEAASKSEGEPQ